MEGETEQENNMGLRIDKQENAVCGFVEEPG
jgi:hypothetical protein